MTPLMSGEEVAVGLCKPVVQTQCELVGAVEEVWCSDLAGEEAVGAAGEMQYG